MTTDWESKLEGIEDLIRDEHLKQAAIEVGAVLELLLRDLYQRVSPKLKAEEQREIADQLETIGKSKPVNELTLGQLVGLYKKTGLIGYAERVLKTKLNRLTKTDLDSIVQLRNSATHEDGEFDIDEIKGALTDLRRIIKEQKLLQPEKPKKQTGSTSHRLPPWTDIVKLHPDVEEGTLTESVFAIDLGAIAEGDENVALVNRDPESFFKATYLTQDLRRLLEEVLASLVGKPEYNRVLKLRTPFGGGKSHTLAALYHAAKNRASLDVIPEAKGFARPKDVAVAVFDGLKFDARNGKTLADGTVIRTMWGWIAWQISPEKAYPIVAEHDQDRVSPGGDLIKEMLTRGAEGRPVLILIDELLKYMEKSAAVSVLDSTLQRQAKDFFQSLTVEVSGSKNAAMAVTLTWSSSEALGHIALLNEIDKLSGRVDQLREPVQGDEILPILQRRLLGGDPDPAVVEEVADAYADAFTKLKRGFAETKADQRQAEEEGRGFLDRLRAAYPFHPALIDIMRERWASIESFQRTRGALRFLASCLHSMKGQGASCPLISPGDVPMHDANVRIKLLKELGAQNEYDPVLKSDIEKIAARIDKQYAKNEPSLGRVKPATRIATAILMYSFGGLKREAAGEVEILPPGVSRDDLLATCVGPELDNITAEAVLNNLRDSCLYLHFDQVRYCFKKDPNENKLVEEARQEVEREESRAKMKGPVRQRIKEVLESKLPSRGAIVWPENSHDIPDEEPRFIVAYLPLEFTEHSKKTQEEIAIGLFTKYGDKPRKYRNGIGLAIPDKKQIETLRRAVQIVLAVERVEDKKSLLKLSKDIQERLKERRRTQDAAMESALRDLYSTVWLLRLVEEDENPKLEIEIVEKGGKPLQATEVHKRITELLTVAGTPKVHSTILPRKIAERVKLGEPVGDGEPLLGIRVAEIVEAFYRDIAPPRLDSAEAIQKGISKGAGQGVFAYVSGSTPVLGPDGKYQVNLNKLVRNRSIFGDEIDLDSGFIIDPSAIPEPKETEPAKTETQSETETESPSTVGEEVPPWDAKPGTQLSLRLRFAATRDQVFKAFPAIANLADKSVQGKITIEISASSDEGYDPSWFRNAVTEPLEEADIEVDYS